MDTCNKLHEARDHLRQAAHAIGDRVLGKDAANHLRQAARSVLQAGLSALDERMKSSEDASKPEAEPQTKPPTAT